MPERDHLPRWSLALVTGPEAIIFAWAALVLPWSDWPRVSVFTALVAATHAITFVLAIAGHGARKRAWRIQSLVSLAYLLYLSWNLLSSAVYIAELYGGLGRGVAAGLAAAYAGVVLLTLPLSAWGIAATGGLPSRRRVAAGTTAAAVLLAAGLAQSCASARVSSSPHADPTSTLELALADWRAQSAAEERRSLFTVEPAQCETPPDEARATAVVTYLPRDGSSKPRSECLQRSTADELHASVAELIADDAARAPLKIDFVTGVQVLDTVAPVVDSLTMRPGLDGVCSSTSCLMPWQLVAADAFTRFTPIRPIPDLRFGMNPRALRKLLEPQQARHDSTIDELIRLEVDSFMVDADGGLRRLTRMRQSGPTLDRAALASGLRGAEAYVLSAQGEDGRFRYMLDPFTGRVSYRGFSVPRQAGTTLALCELGRDHDAVAVARRSLRMLAGIEHRRGNLSAIWFTRGDGDRRVVTLGSTALSMIAFMRCRDRTGDAHDALIGRMARFLLAMQRPDGGFHPRFDLEERLAIEGPDPLYAGGQAVFALTLLDELVAEGSDGPFPPHEELHDAVERSMSYFANPYWDIFARDFFYLEENWHCLAARASLAHHRNDDYEQFCIDYVAFKGRLILDEHSRVQPDFVGGYGFGNILFPHNTGSSGFGEALAAAMAVKKARGLPLADDEHTMKLVLGFLLHHQWNDTNCFACTHEHRVAGGFSEHMASPQIRIDYAQHAWSAMGHGGHMLGLADAPAVQ